MNPYVADPSLYGQYYSMSQGPHGGPHGAYAAYYNAAAYASAHNSAAAAHVVATATSQHGAAAAIVPAYATPQNRPQIVSHVTHHPQRALTTIHPTPTRNSSIKQDDITSWQQIKQQQVVTTASSKHSSTYFPTKAFVKASTTPQVCGIKSDGEASSESMQNVISATSYDPSDGNQTCSKLHEVAVLNRLVEIYEKIDCELSPGIHGVRLKLGNETYQGTGNNFQAAKQNAAATALAQTKYRKPTENQGTRKLSLTPTQSRSAISQVHELASKKGVDVKFTYLQPSGFELKKYDWNTPKEDLKGYYEVRLSIDCSNSSNFYPVQFVGCSDLPQQAKRNASLQALPYLRRLPDADFGISKSCAGAIYLNSDGSFEESYGNIISTLNQCSIMHQQILEWEMLQENGPLHQKFTWSVRMGPYETQGTGRSIKIAKSMAAYKLFQIIPIEWKIIKKETKTQSRKRKIENLQQKTMDIVFKKANYGQGIRAIDQVIQTVNPISALYQYCQKMKVADPDFQCVTDNPIITEQRDNNTFRRTEYKMKLEVIGRTFYSSGSTKKSAKTAVATEAWNAINIGAI